MRNAKGKDILWVLAFRYGKKDGAFMDLQRYTDKAREAVLAAQALATEYNQSQIEPEHLLLSLLEQDGGVVPQIFMKLNVSVSEAAGRLEAAVKALPRMTGATQQTGLSACLA